MLADLHLHSSCSDGTLAPAELAWLCWRRGLRGIAVCDHDTWEQNERLAAAELPDGLVWIAGTELSTRDPDSGLSLHVLGYGLAPDERFRDTLRTLRAAREQRVIDHEEALRAIDVRIDAAAIVERAVSPGKPEVARDALARDANRARLRADGVGDVGGFIRAYLARGRPAFVAKAKLATDEAVRAVRRCGGHPVWAHPAINLRAIADPGARARRLRVLLDALVAAGLEGVEVGNPAQTAREQALLARESAARGLRTTAGSDFHDPGDRETGALLTDVDQDLAWLRESDGVGERG